MKSVEMQPLSNESFMPFGVVLDKPEVEPNLDDEFESYWHNSISFASFTEEPLCSFLLTKKNKPMCQSMEKIVNSDEAYINLGGSKSVLFVASSRNDGSCDEDSVIPFLVPARVSLMVFKGVWHFAPIPLDDENLFLLFLGKSNMIFTKTEMGINPEEILISRLSEPLFGI